MRKNFLFAILLVIGGTISGVCAADDPADATAVSVLSFNIRYGSANDGENAWPRRRELVFDVIREPDCDFIGLQEALRFQIDAIHEAVPGYGKVGVGRGH